MAPERYDLPVDRIPRLEAEVEFLKAGQQEMKALITGLGNRLETIISARLSELKTEQLADMRKVIDALSGQLENQRQRIDRLEQQQDRWIGGLGALRWVERALWAIVAVIAGWLGYSHH